MTGNHDRHTQKMARIKIVDKEALKAMKWSSKVLGYWVKLFQVLKSCFYSGHNVGYDEKAGFCEVCEEGADFQTKIPQKWFEISISFFFPLWPLVWFQGCSKNWPPREEKKILTLREETYFHVVKASTLWCLIEEGIAWWKLCPREQWSQLDFSTDLT